MHLKSLVAVSLTFAVLGCGDSVTGNPEELKFAPELGVDLAAMTRTSSGLYWRDLVVGTGEEALPGATVTVAYTGWLVNGKEFDSSPSATFSLNSVILGWGEGVPGMLVGGKRKLVIPPRIAYGPQGAGEIPGNATLVFDIELLAVR